MAWFISHILSSLHTTAVSYDYEIIASSSTQDFALIKTQKLSLTSVKSLPTLKWSAEPRAQRVKQDSSRILQKIKTHSSWETFVKPPVSRTASPSPISKLESLPNELKLAIMQRLPGVNTLHELSLTSKSFHQFRSQHNPSIVPFVLQNELGQSLFDEAYWVSRAAEADLCNSHYSHNVNDFLQEWGCSEPGSIQARSIPLSTINGMITLHRKITFLVKDFCSWTMDKSTLLHCFSSSHVTLSTNEVCRISRAFYRLELFCRLYSHRDLGESGDSVTEENKMTRAQAFRLFDNWNAWENEEIACVRDYVYARLASVFERIRQAASVKPFKVILYDPWDDVPDTFPSGTVYLSSDLIPRWYQEDSDCGTDLSPAGAYFNEFRAMFLSQGIDFLSRLFRLDDPQKQADMFMSKWAHFSHNPDCFHFFSGQLEATPVRMRYESETREAFFHGDGELFESDDGATGPNFAWAWAGEQKFQPYYASIDRAPLRRWGYVMWDHERLVESSACSGPPNLRSAFWRCGNSLIEAHEQTCWRRLAGTEPGENWDTPLVTEVDDADNGPTDGNLLKESQAQYSGADAEGDDEQVPELCMSASESGGSSVKSTSLCAIAPRPLQANNTDLAQDERDSKKDEAEAQIRLDVTTHPALATEDFFVPAMFHLDQLSESCAHDLNIASSGPTKLQEYSHRDLAADGGIEDSVGVPACDPSQDGLATEVARQTDSVSEAALARKLARPVSPKAKKAKLEQHMQSSTQDVDIINDDDIKFSAHGQIEDEPATEAEQGKESVTPAPFARKIARALSPKAKKEKLEQKSQSPVPESTKTEESHSILCQIPEYTAVEFRAPSPPTSERSGSSDESHVWITSSASSAPSDPPSKPPIKATPVLKESTPGWVKKCRKLRRDPRESSPSEEDADQETDIDEESQIEAEQDEARMYFENFHQWFNRPAPATPEAPAPEPEPQANLSPLTADSSSDNVSTQSNLTKQQRKKANRKARKAATYAAIKAAEEAAAAKVKIEEAKKGHQKTKKESKEMKGKAQLKAKASMGEKGGEMKGKKEGKIGYVFG